MMSNSVFGRTLMAPIKNSTATDIITTKPALRRGLRNPLHKRLTPLTNDRALIARGKKKIVLSNPITLCIKQLSWNCITFTTTPFEELAELMCHIIMVTDSAALSH